LPDIPLIDDLSLNDHLFAQHAPHPGWREEFSVDASNVFIFGNRTRERDPSHFNLAVAFPKVGRGRARTGAVQLVAQLLPGWLRQPDASRR
jgi:hypothetical protein